MIQELDIRSECLRVLSQLGYEVEQNTDCWSLSKDNVEYSLDIVSKSNKTYVNIPCFVLDKKTEGVFNSKADCIGFVYEDSVNKNLYIFKRESLLNYLQPKIKSLKTQCKFKFTESSELNFDALHVSENDTYDLLVSLHLPLAELTENIKYRVQSLER